MPTRTLIAANTNANAGSHAASRADNTALVQRRATSVARTEQSRAASQPVELYQQQEANLFEVEQRPQDSHLTAATLLWSSPAKRHFLNSILNASVGIAPYALIPSGLVAGPTGAAACFVGVCLAVTFQPMVARMQLRAANDWGSAQAELNLQDMLENHSSMTSLIAEQSLAKGADEKFSSGVESATKDYVRKIAESEAFAVNAVTATTALGLLLGPAVAAACLAGGIVAIGYAYQNRRATVKELDTMQAADRTLREHSNKMYAHTVIGNKSEHEAWRATWQERWDAAEKAQRDYTNAAYRHSAFIGYCAVAPPLLFLGVRLLAGDPGAGNVLVSAQTFSSLPATLQTTQIMQTIGNYVSGYEIIRSQRKTLQELITITRPKVSSRVTIKQITIIHNRARIDTEELIARPTLFLSRGIWSICAPNKAGKSTLLHLLKERLGDRAELLCANHGQALGVQAGSTGETAVQAIRRVAGLETIQALLTDEPFSNLDSGNHRLVKSLFHDVSAEKSVIASCVGGHEGELCQLF